MWDEALGSAPPHAIALSLQTLKVTDGRDPANNVVWCPASHLAASPRPFTRLLGLTSRSWPRSENDDPLIPDHVLSRRTLRPVTTAERDRLNFEVIRAGTRKTLVLSRPERSAKGSILSPSALWPADQIVRKRDRIPEHAFSEPDRLLARPQDAGQLQHVRQSQLCWRNWHREATHTAHDGLVTANHPAIVAALARMQSTTSFSVCCVIRSGSFGAMRWDGVRFGLSRNHSSSMRSHLASLCMSSFSSAITSLEPIPGFARASEEEIDEAIEESGFAGRVVLAVAAFRAATNSVATHRSRSSTAHVERAWLR